MGWSIRPRRDKDEEAVLATVGEAFSGPERNGDDEVSIVKRTWALGASPEGMDLVAARPSFPGPPAPPVRPFCTGRVRLLLGGSSLKHQLNRACARPRR
jgi:hypothetical protein